MKKKVILGVMLVGVMAFGTAIGTNARYSKTINSDNNIVRAAKFDVDANYALDGVAEFDLSNQPIAPGGTGIPYTFHMYKNNTEVPMKYSIELVRSGGLFAQNTPVELYIERCTNPTKPDNEKNWELINESTDFVPENNDELFRIGWRWPNSDNDLSFQGKEGKVKIKVTATQIDAVPVIMAQQIYQRDKTVRPTKSCWDKNKKIEFGTKEDGTRVLKMYDTTIYGDVVFEFGKTSDSGKLISSTKDKFVGTTGWTLGRKSEHFFNIQKMINGKEVIFEVEIPTDCANEWLGIQ